MKKGLIFLILLLVSLPGILAATETSIYDGWIPYIYNISSGSDEYRVIASNTHLDDEDDGKILVKKNGNGVIVPFDDCVITDFFKYCFENRSFDREEVDIDNQGKLQPALRVNLIEYSYESSLDTSKSFTRATFLLEQEGNVTISLENTGDTAITNIVLVEKVPSGFEIVAHDDNIDVFDNEFTKQLNLYPGSTWSTTYTIKATSYTEGSYDSEITYDTGNQTGIVENFGFQELSFSDAFEVDITDIKEEYKRGDKGSFLISISNNDDKDLNINKLSITVPPGVQVSGKKELSGTPIFNKYESDLEILPPGQTVTFELDLNFDVVGTYELVYEYDLDVKEITLSEREKTEFEVSIDGIECLVTFEEQGFAGSYHDLSFTAENKGDETFYELEATYSFLGQEDTFSEPSINVDQLIELDTKSIILPFSLDEQSYPVEFTISYRTVDQQRFTCTETKNITVTPAQKLLNISGAFANDTVSRNTSIEYEITLTNLLDTPLQNIQLSYDTDHGITESRTIQTLDKDITFTAIFTVNEFFREDTAVLTTMISIPDKGNYADLLTTNITVSNPYSPQNFTIEKNSNPTISGLDEEREVVDNRNVFEKVMDYIRNFFN